MNGGMHYKIKLSSVGPITLLLKKELFCHQGLHTWSVNWKSHHSEISHLSLYFLFVAL